MAREKYFPNNDKDSKEENVHDLIAKIRAENAKLKEDIQNELQYAEKMHAQDMEPRLATSKKELYEATLHAGEGAISQAAKTLLEWDFDTALAMVYDLDKQIQDLFRSKQFGYLLQEKRNEFMSFIERIAQEIDAEIREKEFSTIPAPLEQLRTKRGLLEVLQYGYVLTSDPKQVKKSVYRLRRQKVQSIFDLLANQVIKEKGPNGQDLSLELDALLDYAKDFYTRHNLKALAKNLPEYIQLSDAARKQIEEALQQGYDQSFIMPAVDLHSRHLSTIVANCTVDYSTKASIPWLASLEVKNRPDNKAYLLLYKYVGIEAETAGETMQQCQSIFDSKNAQYQERGNKLRITGWTLPEYLIVHRLQYEQHGNYLWDFYNSDYENQFQNYNKRGKSPLSQVSYLLDSPVHTSNESGCCFGFYDENEKKVRFNWYSDEYNNNSLGARSAVIIPLN